MEDKIKGLIATFLRVPAEQISHDTIIDRSSVNSSITLHRMYAKLAEEGFVIADYWNIKTFSALVDRVKGNGHTNSVTEYQEIQTNGNIFPAIGHSEGAAIGVDIEDVNAMPQTNDFREDEFYKMNFSSSEIAYCILQPAPSASFAGLFAAKEAIVKANNSNRNKPFNAIVINHNEEGKPTYPGYHLSVSHTNNLAVAVALQKVTLSTDSKKDVPPVQQPSSGSAAKWLFLLSLIISLVALFISLFK